jgi:hypothetical protein
LPKFLIIEVGDQKISITHFQLPEWAIENLWSPFERIYGHHLDFFKVLFEFLKLSNRQWFISTFDPTIEFFWVVS